MCVRVIFHIRFPKKPREDKNLRALALAFFGKPQNSSVRARSDFQMPISVGTFDFADGERLLMIRLIRRRLCDNLYIHCSAYSRNFAGRDARCLITPTAANEGQQLSDLVVR